MASRRIVLSNGLVVLFTTGPLLASVAGGAVIVSLAGVVWLLLSRLDFLLCWAGLSHGETAMR